MQQAEAGAVTEQKAGVEIISRRELQQCQPWQRAFASQHKDSRYYLNANRSQALRAEVSVHKIRILSGMWNRPRSIRTRVSSTKNGILRSPERRQRAELTQSAAPTEAYRRPRPCRGPAISVHKIRILSGMWNRPRSIRTRVSSTKNGILRSPERRQRAELTQSSGADGSLSATQALSGTR